MSSTVALIVVADESTARELAKSLDEVGLDVQVSPRRALDGAAVMTWAAVAGLAIQTAPAIIGSITEFLKRNRVSKITIGKLTIENPRPEDMDRLLDDAGNLAKEIANQGDD